MAKKKNHPEVVAMLADVAIDADAEGESNGPPKFSVLAYTGGSIDVSGWDLPVAIDLRGIKFAKSLIANLDHDRSKRVGHVTSHAKGEDGLRFEGLASAATPYRQEVVDSAADGFVWQASIEANPLKVIELSEGKSQEVNGQLVEGPAYVVTKSTVRGFAFVSHGADDNTTVNIAAQAASKRKGKTMDPEFKKWIEGIGFDADELTAEQIEGLKANYEGRQAAPPAKKTNSNPFEERKLEAKRRKEMRDIADRQIELRNSDEEEIIAIEKMYDHAVSANMSVDQFRLSLYESIIPPGRTVQPPADRRVSNGVLEAAICQAARLPDIDDHFDEQTLQLAHDQFKGRIGLKQLFLLGAEQNGHHNRFSNDVDRETLKAAFASQGGHRAIRAGFSTLDISTLVSATANKFIMRGWNSVDQTPLRISKIQNVRDFKTITTVSLTDSVIFEKVGAGGEIPHGTLSELTYTNKADTYAKMLAITRQDIINDDLSALTDVPMKIGNGAMKKLNDIFWTEFLGLVGASFFASGNSNINTGVATMTTGGLSATEVIFMNQTNPDGTPLGVMPSILLVPTALKSAAHTLMESERLIDGTATATQGDSNIWRGRFRVESSPYISNSSYTGNTSVGWWMLADPSELPVICIAALNGRVEPTVDTAEADFNVLGVQMRGYSDVGVSDHEYRGGVYADGGAS